jgi:hypothetical protein
MAAGEGMNAPRYIRAFGQTHLMHEPVTDAQLGEAIRRLAKCCAPDRKPGAFQYYARSMVHMAEHCEGRPPGSLSVDRIRVMVEPTGVLDGLIEHLLEMVIDRPCGVVEPPGLRLPEPYLPF